MPDTAEATRKYGTLATEAGLAIIADAIANNTTVGIKYASVGDANGEEYIPAPDQVELKNELYQGEVSALYVHESNPNQVVVELYIPEAVGGWWIREIAIKTEDEVTIAVGSVPSVYKPVMAEGAGIGGLYRFIMEVANASVVTLDIDPSTVMASVEFVQDAVANLVPKTRTITAISPLTGGGTLEADRDIGIQDATTEQKGAVQLATEAEALAGTLTTKAVTPKGLSSASVPPTRTITVTSPLTGGGTLAANRSIGIQDATTAQKGATQLATVAETKAGTLATKAVTPNGLASALADLKILGEIRLFGHRSTALPSGWYFPSGQYYALTSTVGAALNALPATFKSDWGITTSGSTIRLCDNTKFFEGTLGRFPRPVNNSNRYPGSVETDAMRTITATSTASSGGTVTATGTFWNIVTFNGVSINPTGVFATSTASKHEGYYESGGGPDFVVQQTTMNISSTVSAPTISTSITQSGTVATENRPYNVGFTPAIYLGV